MYNSVTQVVYFHYPNYERRLQLGLDAIRGGLCPLEALSVALELQPDVPLFYEDEPLGPGWCWMLLSGGALYLASPVGPDSDRAVYTGPCIWALLAKAN